MDAKTHLTRQDTEKEGGSRPDSRATNNPAWIEHAVRQIQAGRDVDTHFELLFRHYEPLCRRLLGRLVPQREVPDLAQEVMLRVYKGMADFRLASSFDTWLKKIVRNVASNAHRHRKTGKISMTSASLEGLLADDDGRGPALAEPETDEAGPLEQTLGSERAAQLGAALDGLPRRMRQCVELHHFHDYRYREIAEVQGVSVTTVKKQVSEGRKRLRPGLTAFVKLFGLYLMLLALVG